MSPTGQNDLRYVPIEPRWAAQLEAIELMCFPTVNPEDLYNESDLFDLATEFPGGSFVVLDGDTPVAMGCGIRVEFDIENYQHSAHDLMPQDGGSGDNPDGEWYYGTSISVNPAYRRRGIGAKLYELRKQVCRDFNLRGIIAGGMLPGYPEHKAEMSAADYVEKVKAGELYDPTLSFQLESGFEAPGVIANYVEDPAGDGWASFIVWHNPHYREPDSREPGSRP